MKRFHVHVAVDELATSVAFYSKLFGQSPAKQEPDYAKWMLDDPALNFAISARGHTPGVNHFGMQADSPEELEALKALAMAATDGAILDQSAAACCYAKSEKHWTIDPQGLAWEHFFTLSEAATFGEDTATQTGACCVPLHTSNTAESTPQSPCCVPQATGQNPAQCCD